MFGRLHERSNTGETLEDSWNARDRISRLPVTKRPPQLKAPMNRTIQLAEEEAQVLRSVLEEYISELRMEVANTDSMDFREDLKRKEEILKSLRNQLR